MENGEHMEHQGKRQRNSNSKCSNACTANDGLNDEGSNSDYFDDVLNGHVNDTVRYSWLKTVHSIHFASESTSNMQLDHGNQSPDEVTLDPNDISTRSIASTAAASSRIESLSRQLLQAKRRLWPAAVECSSMSNSGSPQSEFAEARRACNPLETLGEGRDRGMNRMFMNRSAIKLANIDAMLNFGLTSTEHDQFLFVDLCGSPGGFSEYIMRRFQTTTRTTNGAFEDDSRTARICRGYGMSLVGNNEHGHGIAWKLPSTMQNLSNGCQVDYRICSGADGTGDIYVWDNVLALQQEIRTDVLEARKQSNSEMEVIGTTDTNQGLRLCFRDQQQRTKAHLVVADGGFDAQRDSECQEELAQKLVVCQVAAALLLLLRGGTFVIKMFGFQTSVVRSVMGSICQQFEEVLIVKPISSRPASSERYVVARGFHGLPTDWDGRKWRDRMLLADFGSTVLNSQINNFLDECDRDVMLLNLKTCWAILSHLRRKTASLAAGDNHQRNWQPRRPAVNVGMYKKAWKLN